MDTHSARQRRPTSSERHDLQHNAERERGRERERERGREREGERERGREGESR